MKPLPTEVLSFRPLHKMLTGAIASRLLTGGLNIKIFDVLEDWRTAEQAAAGCDTGIRNTEYFLDALANTGLLEKKEGRYRNMPLSSLYLVSGSTYYLGDLFSMIKIMSMDPLDHLEDMVRNGPRPCQREAGLDSHDRWIKSAKASMPWALGEMGSRMARIAAGLEGFSGFKKMLDLGGGHGVFALYMVQASDGLEAVIFDHAPVAQQASGVISSYGMDKKVSVMSGDYLTDDFGKGYDLVLAGATLNSAKSGLDALLLKIYNCLKPDGYFISLHDGMTGEQTQPALILEWLAGLLDSDQDFRFEQGELAGIMLKSGFRHVRSRTMETPIGLMELDIARK